MRYNSVDVQDSNPSVGANRNKPTIPDHIMPRDAFYQHVGSFMPIVDPMTATNTEIADYVKAFITCELSEEESVLLHHIMWAARNGESKLRLVRPLKFLLSKDIVSIHLDTISQALLVKRWNIYLPKLQTNLKYAKDEIYSNRLKLNKDLNAILSQAAFSIEDCSEKCSKGNNIKSKIVAHDELLKNLDMAIDNFSKVDITTSSFKNLEEFLTDKLQNILNSMSELTFDGLNTDLKAIIEQTTRLPLPSDILRLINEDKVLTTKMESHSTLLPLIKDFFVSPYFVVPFLLSFWLPLIAGLSIYKKVPYLRVEHTCGDPDDRPVVRNYEYTSNDSNNYINCDNKDQIMNNSFILASKALEMCAKSCSLLSFGFDNCVLTDIDYLNPYCHYKECDPAINGIPLCILSGNFLDRTGVLFLSVTSISLALFSAVFAITFLRYSCDENVKYFKDMNFMLNSGDMFYLDKNYNHATKPIISKNGFDSFRSRFFASQSDDDAPEVIVSAAVNGDESTALLNM